MPKQISIEHSHGKAVAYHANVPAYSAPKIVSEKVISGTRYYVDDKGKHHVPEIFDRIFKVQKGKVKGRYIRARKEDPIEDMVINKYDNSEE